MTDTPDNYAWHEAMDRAHVFACAVSQHVAGHPVLEADHELAALAENAVDALFDLYQAISRKAPHMQAAAEKETK